MAKVRAVVLAAGRGIRMGGHTAKTLTPVRGNEALLYYLLKGFERAGIDDVLVVTGYKAGDVESYVREHWTGEAQFVFNARYASWGNFHSLRMGLDQSPGFDVLAVNSDIVVRPEVFERATAKAGDLVLAVERRQHLDPEDMRVRLRDDHVLAIGKELPRAHGHGEFIGVSVIRDRAARLYLDIATDLEWPNDIHLYYEDVFARMVGRVDARAVVFAPGGYAEVDEWTDMEAAAAVIEANRAEWAEPSAEPQPTESAAAP